MIPCGRLISTLFIIILFWALLDAHHLWLKMPHIPGGRVVAVRRAVEGVTPVRSQEINITRRIVQIVVLGSLLLYAADIVFWLWHDGQGGMAPGEMWQC